ncbi:MAG: hypothetical protein ACI9W4_002524 [Rhodothermales bacterium]|jgi:uncharacterized protein YqeY
MYNYNCTIEFPSSSRNDSANQALLAVTTLRDQLHPMIRQTLKDDLKPAMRAKDTVRLRTIRSLLSAMMEAEVKIRVGGEGTLTEEQAMDVVQKAAKQRRDAHQQYVEADRQDLAAIEAEELVILDEYLPAQLSDDDLRSGVRAIVEQTGAASMKDMGKVMGMAMGKFKGKADGKRVQAMVRAILAG